jgi:hypothetical protein
VWIPVTISAVEDHRAPIADDGRIIDTRAQHRPEHAALKFEADRDRLVDRVSVTHPPRVLLARLGADQPGGTLVWPEQAPGITRNTQRPLSTHRHSLPPATDPGSAPKRRHVRASVHPHR